MTDIYFATKRLTISDKANCDKTIRVTDPSTLSREELLALVDIHPHITLLCDDTERCFEAVTALFIPVVAAGGVVQNDKGQALMIHRNGRYDLPKGHWEEGETIEECAIREVMEETGVEGITLGKKICETLHAYHMHGRWELKRTHWYEMQSSFNKPLTPQNEEGIDSAEWIELSQLEATTKESFPTIQNVIANLLKLQ